MVTGSNFLLATGGTNILIDCGLAQGTHEAELRNWEAFPYNPKDISVLIVTHAHIDHIGRIPKLVRDGFKGRIISTEATKTLAEPMLEDSIELLGRVGSHAGKDPLFEKEDIVAACKAWETVSYHAPVELGDGITLEFYNSGHILGSAAVQVLRTGKKLVFTGDLGGGNSPLLSLAEEVHNVDYVVVESVYGDRTRPQDEERKDRLEDIIENVAARGGTLLIPAFSAERTQDLLFDIRELMQGKRVPSMPVYLDSPLAQKITRAYEQHPNYFSPEMAKRVEGGEHIFSFSELQFIEDADASRGLRTAPSPKIIIAGSGMSTGGRALEHERYILPDKNSTILICGYQSAGSLGRRIADDAKEVYIGKDKVKVVCAVEQIYGYSAHMDGEELLEFVNAMGRGVETAFVVMGEPASSSLLAQRIRDYLGVRAVVPEAGESATIEW